MNTNRKGGVWRHKVERWLESAGFHCTVRGLGFSGDDILAVQRMSTGRLDLRLSIEAKNVKDITLSSFTDQAVRQSIMYPAEDGVLPVVVIHRRGRDDVDQAYVVLPGWAFIELVTR